MMPPWGSSGCTSFRPTMMASWLKSLYCSVGNLFYFCASGSIHYSLFLKAWLIHVHDNIKCDHTTNKAYSWMGSNSHLSPELRQTCQTFIRYKILDSTLSKLFMYLFNYILFRTCKHHSQTLLSWVSKLTNPHIHWFCHLYHTFCCS
jgi:hypothetical protein